MSINESPVLDVKSRIAQIFETTKQSFVLNAEISLATELKHLDKRYRTKYNMSMIENLENIMNFGIRKFLKNEDIRWTCFQCGGTICVHKGYCVDCGKKK